MKKLFLTLFASLLLVPSAQATLISVNDGSFGAESVTLDTTSGLEWLDLTVTNNQSRDYVIAQLAGGIYSGWRYATQAEFEGLMIAGGMPIITQSFTGYPTNGYQAAQNILTPLLGNTVGEYGSSYYGFLGLIDFLLPSGRYQRLGAYSYSFGTSQWVQTLVGGGCCEATSNLAITYLGHYLVRDGQGVPTPGALGLISIGLFGFGALRQRPK